MKLIAAAPLLLMVTLALSLPFHQLEARIEAGATQQKLDPLERRGNVHHSNNGPPGPNGPSCEHPPCPGLTRDLNGYDAPDRREMTVGLGKRSSSPGIGPLERGDAGPHFGPGPVQPTWPTCLHPPCPGQVRDLNINDSLGAQDLDARMGNDDEGRINGPTDPTGPSCEHPPCSKSARDVNGSEAFHSREAPDAIMARHGEYDPGTGANGPECEHAKCEHEAAERHEPYQPGHGQPLCEDPPCSHTARDVNVYEPVPSDAMVARHGDHDHDPPSNGPSCKRSPCHGLPSIRALDVSASSQDLTLRELKRNDQDLPPQHHGGVPKDPKVERAHGARPPEPYHGSKSPSPGGPPAALRGLRSGNDVQERKFSGPPLHPVKGGGAGGHGEVATRAEQGVQPRSPVRPPPVSGSPGSGGFGGGSSGSGGGVLGRDAGGHGPLTGRGVLEDDGSELGSLKGGPGGHGAVAARAAEEDEG